MSAAPNVIEVSPENFQSEVVEKSKQIPVLLEFYAEGAEPSDQLAPVLRKMAGEYQGKFLLARVDIRQNPQMVQQLGVRTLPSLKLIYNGQIAQDLEGPQAADESKLRQILDQLTMSPVELVQEQVSVMLEQGDREGAISMLQQSIAQEPNNHGLHVELSDLLIMVGRIDEAEQIIAGVPADTPGIEKPKSRLTFIEESRDLPPVEKLTGELERKEDDLKLRYNLAIRLIVDDQLEQGLEHLLTILKQDRQFEDELARKTMIRVFDMLGKGNELATTYRRKMFTFLH